MQHLYFGKKLYFCNGFLHSESQKPVYKGIHLLVKNRPTPIYHIKDKEVYMTLQYKKTTYNKQRLQ